MKKILILFTMMLFCHIAFTQAINEYVQSNYIITGDIGTNDDFINRKSTFQYLYSLADTGSRTALPVPRVTFNAAGYTPMTLPTTPAPWRQLLIDYLDDIENRVVVVLRHTQKVSGTNTEEEFEKIETVAITGDTARLSSYLLEKKQILFVILGGEETIQQSSFKVIKTKSFFKNSFEETLSLVEALGFGAMSSRTTKATGPNFPIRIVELNPAMIKTPCKIEIDYPGRGQDVEVNIHEKSNFSFQVGVGASQLDKNVVSLDNQELTIELDDTQKEEWKNNLALFLTWHPGRDIDRFKPVWDQDLNERGLQDDWWKWWTYKRMGVFGGLKLSTDPINDLYLGVNYAVTKKFYINYGMVWTNQVVPSVTDVGSISSVSDALDYADRKYKRSAFIGISFAPSAITEILGLDKEEE